MPRKTTEEKDVENFIRLQAEQAQQWQRDITAHEGLEKWVSEGNWTFLRTGILNEIEREAFNTIKNPAFDPTDFAQVAQFKALCQTIDLIETKINQRLAIVKDARTKLRDLEDSTLRDE